MALKITAISDLHGEYPPTPGGDLLIIAGDCTGSDKILQWASFFAWFEDQKYTKKILVGGNHDKFLQSCISSKECEELGLQDDEEVSEDYEYLYNNGTEFGGLKIWGTPHTPIFKGVSPHCKAFMLPDKDLKKIYDKIPDDIDILISHGPPLDILDGVRDISRSVIYKRYGSYALLETLLRVKPKIFICGHIHEGYGQYDFVHEDGIITRCFNVSHMDRDYNPVNAVTEILTCPKRE